MDTTGRPLETATRARMESYFGHDFGQVRVYTDERSGAAAEAVAARAYTVGNNIVFAPGQYAPQTAAGQRLLAHELTHVVQQRQGDGAPQPNRLGRSDDQAEFEAEAVTDRVVSTAARRSDASADQLGPRDSLPRLSATPSALQRQAAEGERTAERAEAGPARPATTVATAAAGATCERGGPEAVAGSVLLFEVDSTDLVQGQDRGVAELIRQVSGATEIEIHGNASVEGPSVAYNYALACRRASTIASLLQQAGVTARLRVIGHGPTQSYGPQPANRNVVLLIKKPECAPPQEAFEIEWQAARATLAKSGALAQSFTFAGALTGSGRMGAPISNLYWFAKLYEDITYEELNAARTGTFQHPEFVLHFIPIFYDMYYDSLQNYLRGDLGKVEAHWRAAFDVASRSTIGDIQAITDSTVQGITAHIKGDMSKALEASLRSFAAKYCDHQRSLSTYYDDFFKNNRRVFEQVRSDFLTDLAVKGPFPGPVERTRQILGTGEQITGFGLDIGEIFKWRQTAWDNALKQLAANPVSP